MLRTRRHADEFENGSLRDREALALGRDDQCRDDRVRERDLDREGCAATLLGADVDGAADQLDVALHYIHADAAAGEGSDRVRGREARMEDEFGNLRLAHPLDVGLARKAALGRLPADRRMVEPAT